MATNFPTSLDTFTNPTSTDTVDNPSHSDQHANANDAIEALQAKVGINNSATTTSHDYKLNEVVSTDKAVGKSATQTLTNKTINGNNNTITVLASTQLSGATPIANGGTGQTSQTSAFDALAPTTTNGDIIYHNGTDNIRLPIGTSGQILQVSGGIPAWVTSSVDRASIVQDFQIPAGDDATKIRISYMDSGDALVYGQQTTIYVQISGQQSQTRDFNTEHTGTATQITGIILLGSYVYVLGRTAGNAYELWRYSKSSLSTSPTQMTLSGQSFGTTASDVHMTTDGTNFYFTHKAGGSANDYVVSKYTLSGTTLTYDTDVTCGSTSNVMESGIVVSNSGNIYGLSNTNKRITKFNSSGTQQSQGAGLYVVGAGGNTVDLLNWNGNYFRVQTMAQASGDDEYALVSRVYTD